MVMFVIFVPCELYSECSCSLYGSFYQSCRQNVATFYVLRTQRCADDRGSRLQNIGQYNNKNDHPPENCKYRGKFNWMQIGKKDNDFILRKMLIEGEDITLHPHKIIFVTYNRKVFLNADLLKHDENETTDNGNYFRTLIHDIERSHIETKQSENKMGNSGLFLFMRYPIFLLSFMLTGFERFLPALKYSSLCLRVYNSLESATWALKSISCDKRITLKTGNYVLATFVDVISGFIILHWFMALVSSTLPSQLLLNTAEEVVDTLQQLLKWLMGIPAGLKLNFAFNNMLGKFFLYHINLWWTFLVLAEPVLDLMFSIFLCFGRLGLTFQAAILSDLLALASFHIYCIYVYAARLYNLQISGLLALWRLFLGRKKNPLRGRVDSCQYTANQLFIGTLAFTILLFLLPTTFMYYIVFTTLRLFVAALAGLLIRVQFLQQVIPLYAIGLWLLKSTSISASLNIQLERRKSGLPLVLSVTPIRGSLWWTILSSVPDPVKKPPCVLWGNLLKNVVTGQLIYPM